MNPAEKIAKRFHELEEQGSAVRIIRHANEVDQVDTEGFQRWASSAMHLIKAVFGEDSPHYQNLSKAYGEYSGWTGQLAKFKGIFLAAKSDYDGGHIYNLEATVSGEIFGDFVVAAKQALSEGQKDVAAVLASAALEDALKRYAAMNGLAVDGKVMQEVINALKSKGLVSGPQKSLLESMPKVRDAAMHAEWTKLTAQDVGSIIGFIEQFLLVNFK